MGLQVLYPSIESREAGQTDVDIIAVHGLNGDLTNTWTHRMTNAFWLKDFLPQDVPNARVMTYGYNASAAFGNTTADIVDHAKGLLSSLVDKREEADEKRRRIIFVGHSLGGIVVKQALFQASIEPCYQDISKSTIGIVFLGTPHRGSNKAAYGKVLATLATTLLHKPAPLLIPATKILRLQLLRDEADEDAFVTVEKHSALLEIDGEEQIPVDANHEEMCKFATRNDEVYEKLFKRIRRIIAAEDPSGVQSSHPLGSSSFNKHYCLPRAPSGIFTDRDEILQRLRKACLPVKTGSMVEKRFIIYGLGGSGKTQVCLKFAEENQERFWGVFWVDASTPATAEQGLLDIARECKVEENPKVVKQWLSSQRDPWLIIFDNADDPSFDLSICFPNGRNGAIIVTTRNPDCRIHATVGSYELGEMSVEEAVTLFLRASVIQDCSNLETLEESKAIVKLFGCLALAIVQAGSYIRQNLCSIGEYCAIYSSHRERLLRYRAIQGGSDYKYSAYTTWDVSFETIKRAGTETSDNAIELIRIFSFLHYDGISEDIFHHAWENGQRKNSLTESIHKLFYIKPIEWDSFLFRDAATLLVSYSLIKIEAIGRRISMHPLVHTWVRDSLSEDLRSYYWTAASHTIAGGMPQKFTFSDYQFRRGLVPHIELCIELCKHESIIGPMECLKSSGEGGSVGDNRIEMAERYALVLGENGRLMVACKLREEALKARQRTLGSEHPSTLDTMYNLAISYTDLGWQKEAIELEQKVLEARQRTLGSEHSDTLDTMQNLAASYRNLERWQEAMELLPKVLEARQSILGSEHLDTLYTMNSLATIYRGLGRRQEAMELGQKVLEARQRTLGSEHPDTLHTMHSLAITYSDLGQEQEAAKLGQKVLEASQRTLGSEHPDTLHTMHNLATSYSGLGRRQEAIELKQKVLEASQRTLGSEHPDTLGIMHSLAISYSYLRRQQEAMELEQKVLEVRQRTLGSEHQKTLDIMYNLAISYRALGRWEEAMELDKKVSEVERRALEIKSSVIR